MLPILRIIPVGGVCLAVLILLLATSPPRDTRQGVSPEMVLARGALIDRRQHPEWPQFLMQAAFRRADEVLSLRDLPDAPVRIEPVALPPERPAIVAMPAPQSQADAAPAPAASPASADPVTRTAALSVDVDNMKAEPPRRRRRRPLPHRPTTRSRSRRRPLRQRHRAAPAETVTKVAVLPVERPATDPDPDDVTGSVDTASGSTIPVDIGETSSTELPIVLPRERPPILSTRERSSRAIQHRRPMQRAKARARPGAKPTFALNEQPASQINLFESLFESASADTPKASSRGKGSKAVSTIVDVPAYPPVKFYPFTSK